MKAYGKRVLIKPDPIQEKSAGGIILPGSAQKDTHTGKVINAGEEVDYLFHGDKVLYFSTAGVAVSCEGESHILVSPENILAIL